MSHEAETQGDDKLVRKLHAAAIRPLVLAWYRKNKRDLPWRRTSDPYRIWISEIMLQQTRVAAVIPYYERFLNLFPDAGTLAAADEQHVLTAWAGLGYYSRARNLQKAARAVVELGQFPENYESLRELPGVGEYTAAAGASIAFGKAHSVLDGNVLRVLSRLSAERGAIKSHGIRKNLSEIAEALLDRRTPGEFNQAMMELGATVCLPKQPLCHECPITEFCRARQQGIESQLPLNGVRRGNTQNELHLLWIESEGKILLWQRPDHSKRMARFWELPERRQVKEAVIQESAGRFRHTIVQTTYLVQVSRATIGKAPDGLHWHEKTRLENLPLSTTAKKALRGIGKE